MYEKKIIIKERGTTDMITVIIVSAIIASVISKILNKNTIGTQEAYFKRWFGIFLFVEFLLMYCN